MEEGEKLVCKLPRWCVYDLKKVLLGGELASVAGPAVDGVD